VYRRYNTVPSRGDYSVSVTLNSHPIHGSPFPVFFSSPPGGVGGGVMGGMGAAAGLDTTGICRDFLQGRCHRAECKFPHTMPGAGSGAAAAAAAMAMAMGGYGGGGGLLLPGAAPGTLGVPLGGGIAAAQAAAAALQARGGGVPLNVDSPTVDHVKEMQRTLHVGNLSPLITVEQLRTLFSFCGTVVDCRIAGVGLDTTFPLHVILCSQNTLQYMTAVIVHIANLTPGSDNRGSQNTIQLMTAGMVHVTNRVTPGAECM
jgi:hypothetical protein